MIEVGTSEDSFSEERVTALIIGDLHFKETTYALGYELIGKIMKVAEEHNPTFIVILGDTLDKKSRADRPAFEQAEQIVAGLLEIAPVYLLIGNHDYDNDRQFLSEKHWFTSFKRWADPPIVVDRPIIKEYDDKTFVFCPYVPRGRFEEALNTLIEDGEMWDMADTIFAHQEFYGCDMNSVTSSKGDKWDEDYPPVISGHIHKGHTISPNIFYPGTPVQHTFGEKEDKYIWFVSWDEESLESSVASPFFNVEKIDLGLRKKKELRLTVKELEELNIEDYDNCHVKVKVSGSSEEFKKFRRGKMYKKLTSHGTKIEFLPSDDISAGSGKRSKEQISFLEVLKEIVKKKTEPVQHMYEEITGDSLAESSVPGDISEEEDVIIELVFEAESSEISEEEM